MAGPGGYHSRVRMNLQQPEKTQMKRSLECLCVALVLVGLASCGGQSEELAPVTEAPPAPSAEEMKEIMQQSMDMGGGTDGATALPETGTPEPDAGEPDTGN